jgi:hypothetical protein
MSPSESVLDVFKGRHFDREVIVLCVRWYLSYKLSSRDLVEMMSERGIALAHTTILRWVQRYVPVFEKQWNHFARPVGGSWRLRRDLYKGEGALDVPISSSGQAGSNGGVPAERPTRCYRGQTLFP